MKIVVYVYCRICEVKSELKQVAKRIVPKIVPARLQPVLTDSSGDLTTTVAWLLGIVVIAGVGYAICTGIIAPNLANGTQKTQNLVNSIP